MRMDIKYPDIRILLFLIPIVVLIVIFAHISLRGLKYHSYTCENFTNIFKTMTYYILEVRITNHTLHDV